jgi:putative transposase
VLRRWWEQHEEQMLRALRQAESGTMVREVCREHGVSDATFYIWKKKYSGLGLSELRAAPVAR